MLQCIVGLKRELVENTKLMYVDILHRQDWGSDVDFRCRWPFIVADQSSEQNVDYHLLL